MSAKPKPEKPKAISILEVRRTRRFIRIHYRKGDEDFKIRSNENPLKAFNDALDAMAPLSCKVCEAGPGWLDKVRVMGVSIGDLRDAKTVSVHVQKAVSLSGKVLELTTPPALLSTPQTEGGVTDPLPNEDAELVATVIEEAKRYVKGERAQGVMDLGDDDEDDDEDAEAAQGELLQMPAGSKGKATRRRVERTTEKAAAGAK